MSIAETEVRCVARVDFHSFAPVEPVGVRQAQGGGFPVRVEVAAGEQYEARIDIGGRRRLGERQQTFSGRGFTGQATTAK